MSRLLPIAALAGLFVSSPALSSQYGFTTLDHLLLDANEISFATVLATELVELLPDGQAIVRVRVGDVRAVSRRWVDGRSPTETVFHVIGKHSDDAVRVFPYQPTLRVGGRYLLFFRGGPWTRGPFLQLSDAIYELQEGHVKCPGGFLFGVELRGLVCGTPQTQLGEPLTESELLPLLVGEVASAYNRRPDFARRRSEEDAALEDTPSALQEQQ